jgi:hypothetical protein
MSGTASTSIHLACALSPVVVPVQFSMLAVTIFGHAQQEPRQVLQAFDCV